MTCAFCGKEFDEKAARRACQSCALLGGCRSVRCPWCGYEAPEEPRLVQWLRRKLAKRHD